MFKDTKYCSTSDTDATLYLELGCDTRGVMLTMEYDGDSALCVSLSERQVRHLYEQLGHALGEVGPVPKPGYAGSIEEF